MANHQELVVHMLNKYVACALRRIKSQQRKHLSSVLLAISEGTPSVTDGLWPVIGKVLSCLDVSIIQLAICIRVNADLSTQHVVPGPWGNINSGKCNWSVTAALGVVSRALQNNLAKIYNASIHIYGENFKLKLCTCAQSMALGSRTKFLLEILSRGTFLQYTNFERIFQRARETMVKQPPVHLPPDMMNIKICKRVSFIFFCCIYAWK